MISNPNADVIVGQQVHLLMWRAGMTQRELGVTLELDQSAVSKKLHGRRSWTVDELLAAAQVLQVDVGQLLPGADYAPTPGGRGRTSVAA